MNMPAATPVWPIAASDDDGHRLEDPAGELELTALRLLTERPEMSQRELALALGLSLGKTHYCLRALMDRGWVKASNFRRSDRKLAYAYVLTPSGLREKLALTRRFLVQKEREFERLQATIAGLRAELATQLTTRPPSGGEEASP